MKQSFLMAATLLLLSALPSLIGVARADPLVPVAQDAPRAETPHALALRARWVTVPGWTLAPYLAEHTQLNGGWSVGLEYLFRRPGFDVVVSLDYSSLVADDGNYLGAGNEAQSDTKTHYLHFDGLSSLSGDVSLIGHWNVLPWLEIRAGAGLGLGGVFGEIYQITNNSAGCKGSPGDPSKCFPNYAGAPDGPKSADTLARHPCPNGDTGLDTPQSPCLRRTDTYPMNVRVVPVLNTLLGLRFKAHKHVYIHLDAGWRLVGFYLGAGPEYRF